MKLFLHVAFLMLFALPLFASAQTTPLRILEKPKPELPTYTGHVEGVVRLKVQFLASGKIGNVDIVSSLTKELDELATAAAKKIRFEPKMVDGGPVSVARVVEYPFSEENGGWGASPQPSTSRRESSKPSGPSTEPSLIAPDGE